MKPQQADELLGNVPSCSLHSDCFCVVEFMQYVVQQPQLLAAVSLLLWCGTRAFQVLNNSNCCL